MSTQCHHLTGTKTPMLLLSTPEGAWIQSAPPCFAVILGQVGGSIITVNTSVYQ